MSLDLAQLPPAVPRPVQWRRLRENLAILHSGDTAGILDAAYSVGDALGGMSDERQLRRLLKTASGQALAARHLDEPFGLADALSDFDALAALPRGSLGREFLYFAERHGLDPRQLLASQHAMSRDYARLDPLRRWLSDRLTVMHDLWHVLTGYDAVPPGEAALMAFSLAQRINDRAIPIFIALSIASGRLGVRDSICAIRRGQRAVCLAAQPLEDLLPLPLDVVRERLAISPPTAAHRGAASTGFLLPALS